MDRGPFDYIDPGAINSGAEDTEKEIAVFFHRPYGNVEHVVIVGQSFDALVKSNVVLLERRINRPQAVETLGQTQIDSADLLDKSPRRMIRTRRRQFGIGLVALFVGIRPAVRAAGALKFSHHFQLLIG